MDVSCKAALLIALLLFLPAAKADYIMPTNFDLNVFQNISTLNVSALPCAIGQIPVVDASGWVCGNQISTGNTSAEINAALNSSFFTLNRPWQGELGWANLTAYPNACPAGEAVTTIGDTLVCTAFMTNTYNATYDAKPSNTYNSTYDSKPSNTYNASYNAQLGHNTTNEIFAATNNGTFQTGSELWNTTAQVQAAQLITGNTTSQIFAAVDNSTFHRINLLLNFSNLTVCAENQIIKINGGAWTCQADNTGSGGNTSAEMLAAINATGNGFFNITSWFTLYVNNATERELFTRAYNASYMTNTYNATYDAKPDNTYNASYNLQLGHNTTAEIQAAQKITGNTTNEIFAAVNNNTFQTGTELWNTTAQVRAAQTINTSAEVNAAINSTFTGILGHNTTAEIQAAQKTTGNTSAEILAIAVSRLDWTSIDSYPNACQAGQAVTAIGDTLTCAVVLTNTYNASYDAQLGHNTTAEINAAINSTFTGQLGKNTTAEIRTAIYSTSMNISNITSPTNCPDAQYVYGKNTYVWYCRADLFNTTTEIRAAQTINTSTEVNAALNASFYTLNRPWLGNLDAGNITGGTLKDILLNGAVFQINGTTLLTAQNLTTGTINATHLVANLGLGINNITVANDFNMNQKNITNTNNVTFGSAAQAQIYWNGTHLIIAG